MAIRTHRGFTLMELLVVLAILLLLMGAAFIGYRQFDRSARTSATWVSMENMRTMVSELEAVTRNQNHRSGTAGSPASVARDTLGLPMNQRYNAPAVISTASLLGGASRLPVVSQALAGFPHGMFEQIHIPGAVWKPDAAYPVGAVVGTIIDGEVVWFNAVTNHPMGALPPPAAGWAQRPEVIPAFATGKTYAVGEFAIRNGVVYVCIESHHVLPAAPPAWNPPAPPFSGGGKPPASPPTPVPPPFNDPFDPNKWAPAANALATRGVVLLDAWQNPLLYVPSGGLVVTDPDDPSIVLMHLQAPDGSPFIASAGPDGIFARVVSTGSGKHVEGMDDNMYSFER